MVFYQLRFKIINNDSKFTCGAIKWATFQLIASLSSLSLYDNDCYLPIAANLINNLLIQYYGTQSADIVM